MAQGMTGLGQSAALDGAFEGRIERSSNTVLLLSRYKGVLAEVNGDVQVIPSAGLSVTIGAGGSDTINSSGADSAAKTAVSTLYYVYVSSGRASPNPNAIRLSTTAPSLYNGRKYLATSGNGAEWRFVGWVRTDASGNLADSDTQRFVVNYYNRLKKRLYSCPAYIDNNASTTYTVTSTDFVEVNGGTGSRLEFISNGEDVVAVIALSALYTSAGGQAAHIGVSEDSATVAVKSGHAVTSASTYSITATVIHLWAASEGYHYTALLGEVSAGTGTYYADFDEVTGADVSLTYITAEVMI